MFIDTHCHLDFADFDADREEVIKNFLKEGITAVVNIGTYVETSRKSLTLSEKHPFIHPTAGIHPTHVKDISLSVMKEIEQIAGDERIVGIGETGLDFDYGREEEEKQKDFFRAHIDIAGRLGLPLVVHQRESRDEVIEILEKSVMPEKVVFHCFGGDRALADYCIEKGFYISFTGIITFKKADDVKKIAGEYPLERIMAETDSPYLAPVPFRGKRNDPSMVRYVVEAIASIRGMELQECAQQILHNSRQFFGM